METVVELLCARHPHESEAALSLSGWRRDAMRVRRITDSS